MVNIINNNTRNNTINIFIAFVYMLGIVLSFGYTWLAI